VARSLVKFLSADHGAIPVYKFRVGSDPAIFLWFDYGPKGEGLYTTSNEGPFSPGDPISPAPLPSLDALLRARGLTKALWNEDLIAQFGERVAWQRG